MERKDSEILERIANEILSRVTKKKSFYNIFFLNKKFENDFKSFQSTNDANYTYTVPEPLMYYFSRFILNTEETKPIAEIERIECGDNMIKNESGIPTEMLLPCKVYGYGLEKEKVTMHGVSYIYTSSLIVSEPIEVSAIDEIYSAHVHVAAVPILAFTMKDGKTVVIDRLHIREW
ncbi:MAG: hypothetical protein QXP70_06440 [Methanomassiliicoccales archaeon]